MIRKVLEIKNLGIFDNYRWDINDLKFEKFNLIYGWNGSGKTTLTQLFSSFEKGKLDDFPDLKYKIETDEGEYTQEIPFIKKIRVFNEHYISQNIDVFSGKANPIYILGEENKKLAELIRKDDLILKGNPEIPNNLGKLKELELKKQQLENKETELGKTFSSVAKIISQNISGVTARDYRKNNAIKDFDLLKNKQILTPESISGYLSTLKQQKMEKIPEIEIDNFQENLEKLISEAKTHLNSTVESIIIHKLKDNPKISTWVEDGYRLHIDEKSKNCEFCGQVLPDDRLHNLASFFNEADKKLKNDIDNLLIKLDDLQKLVEKMKPVDKANLFSEYQSKYADLINNFENNKKYLIKNILDLNTELKNKKLHTTENQDLITKIDIKLFIESINTINECINNHNIKSDNFLQTVGKAEEKLKKHYLSEIFDEVQSSQTDITNLQYEINILENGDPNNLEDLGIKKLQERIEQNKNKISESGLACDEINKQLETFLGRNELVFEDSHEGYKLKRNGKVAKNLSEGEKTAIAFVYFTIHLKDRDFDIQNDIVVIDDPISSLDSNSLFQAFSFLKNSVKDCAQVFVFTHNFDFLQLLLNWLQRNGSKEFFMIKNQRKQGKRVAKIDRLDELLRKYHTEYQYLFKLLYNFNSDGSIDSVYHMPNVARKVLDNFLLIMVPDSSNPYHKLSQIDFDDNKKTAIYKFTNDQSHITGKGFDPSLPSEALNVISYLLEMMEAVFPEHYKVLVNSVISSN